MSGTHMDALGHFGINSRLFKGFSAEETVMYQGLEQLGIGQAAAMIQARVGARQSALMKFSVVTVLIPRFS